MADAAKKERERRRRIPEARIEAQHEFDHILAKARKAEQLSGPAQEEIIADELCEDIDKLFARLADIDQEAQINLTKEIGDQFAQYEEFKNLNIKLEQA